MRNRTVGILAHVDAGKTTLSEALLYTAGRIRKLGRVDHRDTYLDTHELERERGITIFSKQATFETAGGRFTLLDTPGHVDFSAEAERVLSVLDCAILVISGTDGVQAHTETLWHLLKRYHVPTVIFVTKTDLTGADRAAVGEDLRARLSDACADADSGDFAERAAMTDEAALEEYLSTGTLDDGTAARLVAERKLFPVYYGSGLRLTGVDALLNGLDRFIRPPEKEDGAFSARVFKIGHDKNGVRLTHLRVTDGRLSARQTVRYSDLTGEEREEKVTALRVLSGERSEPVETAEAGDVVAVTGLDGTFAGQGIGDGEENEKPLLEPVLNYRIRLPQDCDPRTFLPKLRELEEEEPLLSVLWDERYGEIHAQLMGQIQCEVLTALVKERYGVAISFEDGRILYKETVSGSAEGVGHFEPLRHYAEVHLLIEPLPQGSGTVFCSRADEDYLERSWQRLILSHLEEKRHRGTLIGAPLTDVKITVLSGRSHIKHTQSGDFREATCRAVRQGLMNLHTAGKTVLLEPYYAFRVELPTENVGRAISDLVLRSGTVESHETGVGTTVLTGRAPVSELGDYPPELTAYTHGKGRISLRVEGYYPCHDAERVMAAHPYDPTTDPANTPDSVFCSHGSGFIVPWYDVPCYMHLASAFGAPAEAEPQKAVRPRELRENFRVDDRELDAIMDREFGPIRRKVYGEPKKNAARTEKTPSVPQAKTEFFIVDGYNVIHAWEELDALSKIDLEQARERLLDLLANDHAFTGREMMVVFDAYQVKGNAEKTERDGLTVVYTAEGELADVYIERLTEAIGKNERVRVVTSDGLIQLQTVGAGLLRMSAREFREEILSTDARIREELARIAAETEKTRATAASYRKIE